MNAKQQIAIDPKTINLVFVSSEICYVYDETPNLGSWLVEVKIHTRDGLRVYSFAHDTDMAGMLGLKRRIAKITKKTGIIPDNWELRDY